MKSKSQLETIRSKDKSAIFKDIEKINLKIVELKSKNTLKKLKNYREIRQAKLERSRLWTILNEKIIDEVNKEKHDQN